MKQKITVIYLLFGSLSVVLVGFILYMALSQLVIAESVKSTQNAVYQTGQYLEVYIEKLKSLSGVIINNQDVREYFSGSNNLAAEDYDKRIYNFIDSIVSFDDSIQDVVIISKDGKLFSNDIGIDMAMSEDMMAEDWYKSALENDMPTLTSARMQPFSMDKNLWVISLSQEIVSENGDNIGVAVIDIPYTVLEHYLMDLDLGNEGFAYILNKSGDVVFHQNRDYYTDEGLKNTLIALLDHPSGYQDDGSALITHYDIKNTDWTLTTVDSLDALHIVKRQVLETVLMGLLIIFFVVAVTGGILKRLTEDIKNKEKELYQYEMNALYSQINPHFLYNSLDTIVWMAEFDQKESVISITKALAKFFRLSLNQGNDTTTLKDEIAHVAQYLFIQKQRYQEKLGYEFDIDPSTLDFLVPKIILQPIVENAIYHGIKDSDENGEIIIKSKKFDDHITITVSDNGIGFNEDSRDHQMSSKVKLGGVGLKNVEARLKLFYGDAYGVKIESKEGKGTCVTLKLGIIEKKT